MTLTRSIVTAIALWLLFIPNAFAVNNSTATIGQPIPHPLNLNDQTGTPQTFKTLKGGRGVILLFTRSLDW